MNTLTSDSLSGLVSRALERMAFVITEPCEDTPGELLAQCVAHAVIELRGPHNCTLAVSATPGMVREVASGMMGVDGDEIDVDEQGSSTVCELANILAGELVMLLTGGDSQMGLGLPREATDEQVGALVDATSRDGCHLGIAGDMGRLLLVVRED